MKFSFNKNARTEAISALKKLGTIGSPASLVFSFFFEKLGDKIALAIASLLAFIATSVAIVFIAGLEDKHSKQASEAKVTKKSAKSVNDTS